MRAKKIWNPTTCTFENGRQAGSIIDNSVIVCGKIIEETKTFPTKSTLKNTVPTNFNEKNVTCKLKVSIFYLLFHYLPQYHR